MNHFKSIAVSVVIVFASGSVTAAAKECGGGLRKAVRIEYLGNDAERAKDWHYIYGKYVLKNNSAKTLSFDSYKDSVAPVVLYPMGFKVERSSDSGWSEDVRALDHPRAPDATVSVPPGGELLFLGQSRRSEPVLYRIKIREKRGCWLTSDAFHFAEAGATDVPN
ncbi:hypothetical protein [Lysobacter sp. Hz 25]|uniref:hypothetical protein n=1 Tax=Lysobacter sp. Hz 25 TaxID=3383698 RepID=UPI0038D38F9B